MRKKLYASASVTVLTAGLVGGATSIAFAAPGTGSLNGASSGNQVNVPVDVRADLCGNSLAALGISEAQCEKVAEVLYASSDEGQVGSEGEGSGGAASNNTINIPVSVAVDICGNSAAVAGVSKADCTTIVEGLAAESGADNNGDGEGGSEAEGSGGPASNNTINVPVDVAVDVCGNSLAVLGDSEANCEEVVDALQESEDNEAGNEAGVENNDSDDPTSGNEVTVPANAAVEICGNAVSVLGVAESSCMKKISDEEAPEEENPGEEKPENPEKPGDDGDKGEKEESPEGGDEDEAGGQAEEQAAPGDDTEQASGGLPVTGSALAGLIAAATAALGGGGAAMYFARKRKAASALGDEA